MSVNSSGASPRLTFDSLNLSNGLQDYAYSSGASFTTGSPARPFTPPDLATQTLTSVSTGELSSDTQSISLSHRRRSTPDEVPPSVAPPLSLPQTRNLRYSPLRVRVGGRERRRRLSKDDYVSEDDDDYHRQCNPVNSDQ